MGLLVVLVAVAILAAVTVVVLRRDLPSVTVAWRYDTTQTDPSARPAPHNIVLLTDGDGMAGLDGATGAERWRDPRSFASVEVGQERVYASCCRDAGPGGTSVVAIDPDSGRVLWRVDRTDGGEAISTSFDLTLAGELVIVSSNRDEVFAVDAATGAQRWTAAAPVFGTPVVSGDTVAVPGRGEAVGFDVATGRIRWRLHVDPELDLLGPAVFADMFVFASTVADRSPTAADDARPTRVIAIDPRTGERLWQHETDAPELTPPVTAGDHVVTAVAEASDGEDAGVLALDSAGRVAWQATDVRADRQPVVSPAGVFVTSGRSDDVIALDAATGTRRWTYTFDEFGGGPILATDQALWAVGDADELVGLDPATGEPRLTYRAAGSIVSLDAAGSRLLVGTYGDGVFALDVS